MSDVALIAALITGLLGGMHCAAMCGPIVLSLSAVRNRHVSNSGRVIPIQAVATSGGAVRANAGTLAGLRAVAPHLFYSIGRVGSYTIVGVLAGAAGSGLRLTASWIPLPTVSLALTSVSLLIVGSYLVGWRSVANLTEKIGAKLWRYLQPIAARSLTRSGTNLQLVGVGAIWGLLPCGMVYTITAMAFASASAVQGGLLLLAFGLGTIPNLLLIGGFAHYLASFRASRLVRTVAGGVIIASGLVGLLRLGFGPPPAIAISILAGSS